jgi:hypothetical protein
MHAHGAVFAEVKVDPGWGQVRATRLVGAFAAGTIINPRLVRSQYYGGMIWGVSFALHERAVLDPRPGRVMNATLAEYHVPVNADVPSLEAILAEEADPYVNALGIKCVGEIGITGTAGAIANACVPRDWGSRPPLSDHHRAADRSRSGLRKCDMPAGNRRRRKSYNHGANLKKICQKILNPVK